MKIEMGDYFFAGGEGGGGVHERWRRSIGNEVHEERERERERDR